MPAYKNQFLSTPSARRATAFAAAFAFTSRDFYPRPPRGGRLVLGAHFFPPGNDFYPRPPRGGRLHIQITKSGFVPFLSTPSARRATDVLHNGLCVFQFLSTPSARRATLLFGRTRPRPLHFYPRPPRGGRPALRVALAALRAISIHALREEGDSRYLAYRPYIPISIHALREEGDLRVYSKAQTAGTISIHALREEGDDGFQLGRPALEISIHALREEGDALPRWYVFVRSNFYPRPPRGGRPMTIGQRVKIRRISIHALREEGDCEANNLSYVFIKFLSTPSARRATRPRFLIITTHRYFYPRPPRGGRRPVHGGSQLR